MLAGVDHAAVLAAVARLASPYRETVVAVDVVGLSYAQAAKALRCAIGTIMGRLHRGRERLEVELRGLDLAPLAA